MQLPRERFCGRVVPDRSALRTWSRSWATPPMGTEFTRPPRMCNAAFLDASLTLPCMVSLGQPLLPTHSSDLKIAVGVGCPGPREIPNLERQPSGETTKSCRAPPDQDRRIRLRIRVKSLASCTQARRTRVASGLVVAKGGRPMIETKTSHATSHSPSATRAAGHWIQSGATAPEWAGTTL